MKKVLIILIPIGILLFYFSQMNNSSDNYIIDIEKYWQDRHDFFRNSQNSPFTEKAIEYNEVSIFPPNPKYRVVAKLERYTSREIIELANSDGSITSYLKFANSSFTIDGKKQSLLILKLPGFKNQYLTAFGDETSGESSYGGGRYLDVEIGKSNQVTLDFNKAYNPYCAYFDDYSCPLPPRENLLTVRIEAGEKVYAK